MLGNKRLKYIGLEHVPSLKDKLKIYSVTIFGDGPARNLTLVERSIKKLLMVFCMQKKLETNVSRLLCKAG